MTFSKLVATSFAIAALAVPAASRAQDAKPGEFKIPGTDSTLKLYGYVQLDTTFDFSGRDPNVEGNDWAVHTANVPLNNTNEAKLKKDQLYLTARTSRFGIQTNTPTSIGAVGVKLEGDFNGTNLESGQTFTNSVLFRLRHAYGTVDYSAGQFLVGQTWSNFLDLASYPDVVDFNGPGSIALIRQPMIKYTAKLGPSLSLAVAAENAPGTDGNDYAGNIKDDGTSRIALIQSIPDFSANLGASGAWGSASVRGITTQRKVLNASDPALATKQLTKQGLGGAASGAFKFGADTLVAHGVYGWGISRYIFNVGLSSGPVVAGANGDLENVEAGAYHVGFTHVWNPMFRSNLVWSQTFIQNPKTNGINFSGSSLNRRIDQAFVNTFWTAAKNVEFGLEYAWGRRIQYDDLEGRQNRVTGTFHYNFF